MFVQIKPQAPSQLGKDTEYDKSFTPWKVLRLHLIFDVWSADDLLRSSPSYFVTKRVYDALLKNKFTGIEFGPKVKTELSETFKNIYQDKKLPDYYLITVFGEPNKDDFGINDSNKLIVSENVFSMLRKYQLSDAKIIRGKID